MILRRFYEPHLAQASYLIGCSKAGEAIVIDPNLDIEPYLSAAREEGVRITAVTETHIHADFVSGSHSLAARTGAQRLLSGLGDAESTYTFPTPDRALSIRDGDRFRFGEVQLEALHTPGHTPEHLAFLVTDESALSAPVALISGDLLFVGDVGRPDLTERVAGQSGAMRPAARALFHSIERLRELPDHLIVWPGHGSGSACGKRLGGAPATSLGYETRANWAFNTRDEAEFVETVLSGQPDPPRYFADMKRINLDAPTDTVLELPEKSCGDALAGMLKRGVLVVDLRSTTDYAAGHVPGTINIPFGRGFINWAGSLLGQGIAFALLAESCSQARSAARALALIGLNRVQGWLGPDALDLCTANGGKLEMTRQISASELRCRFAHGEALVVDVRNDHEWTAGHIPGAVHIPLNCLMRRAGELAVNLPIVVCCQSGMRSAIGASLLRRLGHQNVSNLDGGFSAYLATA